ncbi:hypothetical protein [Saccharopolyspora griseoalba]|uniref:Uncharacterized protein n=1 Tax=Saccharopolyspora griseoalba TaxID=1431848 RepID=A0ABW2LQ09_9PSEU
MFCDCDIGRRQREWAVEFVRTVLLVLAVLLATVAGLRLGVAFQVMDQVVVELVASASAVSLALFVFLRAPLEPAAFSWRSLGVGDWVSVIFFVLATTLGWIDFWETAPGIAVGYFAAVTTLLHCAFFWAMLIFFLRLSRSLRKAFGHHGSGASLEELRERRIRARHMIVCGEGSRAERRYRSGLATGARARRRQRRSARWEWCARKLDRLIGAYENSSTWMSAACASGGLFIWAVQNLEPGPLGAFFLFTPFAAIPLIDFARGRLTTDRSPSAGERGAQVRSA